MGAPTTAQLVKELHQLRQDLADLREQLGTEVRTQRLVVLDRTGREAVYTHELADAIQLVVSWPIIDEPFDDDLATKVVLQADSENSNGHGSVYVEVAGDVCCDLSAEAGAWSAGHYSAQQLTSALRLEERTYSRTPGSAARSEPGAPYLVVDPQGVTMRTARDCVVAEAPMQLRRQAAR